MFMIAKNERWNGKAGNREKSVVNGCNGNYMFVVCTDARARIQTHTPNTLTLNLNVKFCLFERLDFAEEHYCHSYRTSTKYFLRRYCLRNFHENVFANIFGANEV